MTDRARAVSAFATPDGLHDYTVTPFGTRNAPSTLQRLMNIVTSGLIGCKVYLDDVVVYVDAWEDKMDKVWPLFARLREANQTINVAKLEFGHAEVEFLGHRIGRGKVRPREPKIQPMADLARPRDRREIRRFLGMAKFHRRFVEGYSDLVAPLIDLTRTKLPFVYAPRHNKSHKQIILL